MLSSVQNYQTAPSRVAFKAGNNVQTNEHSKEKQPYKTHAGLKTGIGYGVIEGGLAALLGSGTKALQNIIKRNSDELGEEAVQTVKTLGKSSKTLFIYVPIAILTSIGCGALVDKKINDKHAQFADKLEKEGKKEILKNDDNAEITKQEQVYCKKNTGKKLGVLLGAVVSPLLGILNTKVAGNKISMLKVVSGVITGALGGLILGSITDKIANKGAAKFADKQAAINDAK